ncbi:MAG: hypothetical protein ABIO35_08505 [Nitrobacter sp.]
MIEILIVCLFIAFIYWRMRRAKEQAAELAASGVLREPLFWMGNALSLTTLGLSMYMASLRPAHIQDGLWFTVIALFIATVIVWLILKRRHGI